MDAIEKHENARLFRQSLIDQGCRIQVTCSPRERKWRVMVWTDYKTRKDDERISRFKGWSGKRIEGKGDSETEATENLQNELAKMESEGV
jgi:hypothetical protein